VQAADAASHPGAALPSPLQVLLVGGGLLAPLVLLPLRPRPAEGRASARRRDEASRAPAARRALAEGTLPRSARLSRRRPRPEPGEAAVGSDPSLTGLDP